MDGFAAPWTALMMAVGVPKAHLPLIPRKQKQMAPLSANAQYLPEQLPSRALVRGIMSEYNARSKWQALDRRQQVVPEPFVGHQPNTRQGVASVHATAYSGGL